LQIDAIIASNVVATARLTHMVLPKVRKEMQLAGASAKALHLHHCATQVGLPPCHSLDTHDACTDVLALTGGRRPGLWARVLC
jgi:hypothetical protein